MHRFAVLAPFLAVLVVGLFALGVPGLGTVAQDGTPSAPSAPSVVGSWVVDSDAGNPDNPPALAVFHADGTYVELHEGTSDGVGAWADDGAGGVALTIVLHDVDENQELQATITVRATVEVDATGDSFTAPYDVEATAPDGTVLFTEQGTAEGTRIRPEPAAPLGTLPAATPGS